MQEKMNKQELIEGAEKFKIELEQFEVARAAIFRRLYALGVHITDSDPVVEGTKLMLNLVKATKAMDSLEKELGTALVLLTTLEGMIKMLNGMSDNLTHFISKFE
jgi:DNA helicase TIP49 (TBP-interacting protein)